MPRTLLAAVLLTASVPAFAQVPPEIPLRDFFRNPDRAYFRVAGDGKTISFMQPWERRMNVYVQPAGAGAEPVRITSEKDRDIPDYFWKGGDRVVYLKDIGGDENNHVVVSDRRGGAPQDLTPFPGVRAQIVDPLFDQPGRMLVGLNRRNKEAFDVYDLDLASGELKLVAENPGKITDWGTDHDGKVRYAVATDGVNQVYLYRDDASAPFKPVLTTNFRDRFAPQGFTPDNKKLYAISNIGRDKAAVVLVDPTTAKEERVVYGRDDYDIAGVEFSKKRKVMTLATWTSWHVERKFFDDETERTFASLGKLLPGKELIIQSSTDDEEQMVVAAFDDRTQGTRYLYDRKADKLVKLGDVAPWMNAAHAAPMKPVKYTSRDGLTIHGYLTLPLGRPAKNLPVVVNPHGGPWVRDGFGYNPEVQFLANRGYAVLQMNYRGSTGYGRKFWEASFGQWGLAMQDDIADGAQWLVKEGIADPRRICIYGGSYGGYATLMGLVRHPDLYACGIDYVGVANLFTFMKTIPPYWKPLLEMFYEMVGNPDKDVERLRATSAVFHADRIKAPLLIAQGARDPRVNKAESDQMVEAMKKRGVDVEYIVKENEGHGFNNEENRFEFYGAMERFLAKHLK